MVTLKHKIIRQNLLAFTEHDILFLSNFHLLKCYLVPQNYLKTALIILITQIKRVCKFSNFRLP